MSFSKVPWVSASLLFVTAAAFGQNGPTFEVASIKKAEPLNVNSVMSGGMNLGMTIDNAIVNVKSLSLAELIRYAYQVKTFQISGPEWLGSDRFSIVAKMPPGATREQVPEMMKALLADRFKLTFHRESKDQSVYALTVMKTGLKLTESAPDDAAPSSTGPAAPLAPAPTDGGAQIRVGVTSDTSGNIASASVNGSMKMIPRENGMRIQCTKMNTTGMMELLGRFVERPVIDDTGLKSRYDFDLDVGLQDMLSLAKAAGINVPVMPQAADVGGSVVFTAIQQYGLKLEPRKAAIDMLMIDRVEKTPTDN
jgi:uncharacterized protein (TIGR03435 family)